MKFSKLITFGITISIFIIFAGTAFSQDDKDNKPVTIATILENAKCPLTEEQAKQLKEFKPGQGFGIFRILNEMFDENQIEALKMVLGTVSFRNGPERPRNLFQVIMFENAGCPLTESQVQKIKELPMGQRRGGIQGMTDILTDEQQEVMQKFRGNRRGGGTGQRGTGGSRPVNR